MTKRKTSCVLFHVTVRWGITKVLTPMEPANLSLGFRTVVCFHGINNLPLLVNILQVKEWEGVVGPPRELPVARSPSGDELPKLANDRTLRFSRSTS